MIQGIYTYIRTTDPDDAPVLHSLYDLRRPRAALLDMRREPMMPTVDELREMLGRKEAVRGAFFTIENRVGEIIGFCGLRGVSAEARFAETNLMMCEESDCAGPEASEAIAFLQNRGFNWLRMRKLIAHCLDRETALRGALLRHGFQSEGVQREVLYAAGRRHNLEVLSLFARKAGG